jgi:hypothetical protein
VNAVLIVIAVSIAVLMPAKRRWDNRRYHRGCGRKFGAARDNDDGDDRILRDLPAAAETRISQRGAVISMLRSSLDPTAGRRGAVVLLLECVR